MVVKSSRKQISLPKEFIKKLSKFTKDAGFASDSETIRHCVSESMKEHYGDSSKRDDMEDKIAIHDENARKQFELIFQRLELINIHLNKHGVNSDISNAFRKISNLLIESEEDLPTLLRKCRAYDEETVKQVLSLIINLGIINYHSTDLEGEIK